ncbi:PhnD/SsuA/transferrin family substrate-binding protein [Bosea sp. 124]|uniref:PhnD/SsuA/transferrin family substrate-binding protein n=1 Tax=Bosea sp. 124 TaxID=2135642 RepID=UPI000D3C2AD3|nr:PhnD/SsuA/transferrin family substrate-binding protein [Bosea sp. 124]PTM42909.1 phosphonate transport system substrate-binding protein [Bosea sp. 124]
MLKTLTCALVAAAALLSVPAVQAQEAIRFAVTDIDGAESLQREFGPFKAALEKVADVKVQFFAVSGRTAAVEAMAAGQVDFVLTGPAEYVVFKARTQAVPVVGWQRPDYFAQVVVLASGPVKSVADLKGKTISFGEIGSSSQHLGPAQALADAGLKYNVDYKPIFVKRNVAVEAMKRGDIGAIGLNLTHLQRIRESDTKTGFAVVARGRDLPNDVMIASPKVKPEVVAKMRKAFLEHGGDLMKAVTTGTDDNRKFLGGVFLPDVKDTDYDYVRAIYATIGITEFNKFIE